MLLVVCSIVSLFAGCGKKTPESTADPAVNQSESTPPEEEIEDAIKARKDAEDRLFNRFLKELNEQTH